MAVVESSGRWPEGEHICSSRRQPCHLFHIVQEPMSERDAELNQRLNDLNRAGSIWHSGCSQGKAGPGSAPRERNDGRNLNVY
jgi:hypothetical protein